MAALERSEPPRVPEGEAQPPDLRVRLHEEYEELHRLLSLTPGARGLRVASAEAEGTGDEEAVPDSARDRAVRLGVAFHEAMDAADLVGVPDLEGLAREAGARQRLDDAAIEVLQEMLGRSLGSPLMERVRRARLDGGRVWRELPYVRPLGPGPNEIEEGKIDLLFEEADGWVLVDYKTDRIPEEGNDPESFFTEKYAGQVRAYVSALHALGIKINSAFILLARTGVQIEMPCR